MSQKLLPPLEVDTNYRVADFQSFEFGHRDLRRAVTGEDTSILHLHLKNRTRLDLPAPDEEMVRLLNVLMSAYPKEALDGLRRQPWSAKVLKPE